MDDSADNLNLKRLKFKKLKFWISFGKWFIGSVALVFVTILINRGFEERTVGIQEMQAFDRYVNIILKADNIEERWKLSEFFSMVTPTKRLREKWTEYNTLIKKDYENFKRLKEKEYDLSKKIKEDQSQETIDKLDSVKKQLEPYEKKLATPLNNTDNTQSSSIMDDNALNSAIQRFKANKSKEDESDSRYEIEENFKKINEIYYSVVGDLIRELGEPYQTIQTDINRDYDNATYSNKYGIISKFDKNKEIWPRLKAQFYKNTVIISITENGKEEAYTFPSNPAQWDNIEQFIKSYFVKRLEKLK